MTARLRASVASRTIDSERRVCAIRLAGCAPADLLEHEDEELLRDEAEGMRVAYVAATRARDLLVIPAVGDEEREGWIQPLNRAIYPPNGRCGGSSSSARLRGVQIERFGIGAPKRQRRNEHGFSRTARPSRQMLPGPPSFPSSGGIHAR